MQDLLLPVAERSIKIALTTTEHIIKKVQILRWLLTTVQNVESYIPGIPPPEFNIKEN